MRIALIGTAPSSVGLAPYDDPSWTIWPCSPGCMNPVVRRADAWFEIHDLSDPAICSPDYVAFLARLGKPVYTIRPDARIPQSVAYPRAEIVAKYGEYFFTSSLSWMLALALEQPGIEEIGLWGVDMSHSSEYQEQRPGCHYFIQLAKQRGIKVTVPVLSDLLAPPALYGFSQTDPMYVKLQSKMAELQRLTQEHAEKYEWHRNQWHGLNGAIENLRYVLNTWTGSRQ